MLPALPLQSVDLDADDSRTEPERQLQQLCPCSLLAKIRLQRFEGWERHDDDGSVAAPCRGGDANGRSKQSKERGPAAAVGNARVCQFKHSVDDIGWYIREYREKCSRSSQKTAKLPLLTISRQFVSFRKPRYVQMTAGKSSDVGRQRAATVVQALPFSLAECSGSGGGADNQLRPTLTSSARSDERRKWYEADRDAEGGHANRSEADGERLTRSATVASVPNASETPPLTGAEPTPFAKARSASVLDRAAPPLSGGEPSSAVSADAATASEAGFLTLEERSRRASTKSRARRRYAGSGVAVAAAAETAADVCVKERQFIFPLPVRATRGVVGKSSTRAGTHRRQAVDAPALSVRDLGLSSKLAKTLGELIEDFRLERQGLPAERRPAAAAHALMGARSRSRAVRDDKRTALYYHLPLANSLSGFAEGLGADAGGSVAGRGGGGAGRVGRLGHAELFDYSSAASAAASYGP